MAVWRSNIHHPWSKQVFFFVVNERGLSWAYATPDFKESLHPDHLEQLRSIASVGPYSAAKMVTKVCPLMYEVASAMLA